MVVGRWSVVGAICATVCCGDDGVVTDLGVDPDGDTPVADGLAADIAGVAPGDWITIGAGTFVMGSPTSEACRKSNEHQHQVTLTHTFEIQAMEVTQGEYETLMGYNPSSFASCGTCAVESLTTARSTTCCLPHPGRRLWSPRVDTLRRLSQRPSHRLSSARSAAELIDRG